MGICSGKCTSTARLDGKTAIITGSNAGIGKFTAFDFYKRGCRVIMACRSIERGHAAREDIIKQTQGIPDVGDLVLEKLDLSSLKSVREFSEKIMQTEPQVNLLINNAGIMMCPKSFTADGFEMQFGTNHLGHFLLTLLLLPRILNSAPARILNLSSITHYLPSKVDWDDLNAEKTYSPLGNYGLSKLANIYFTKELARRLEGRNVNVYALHPGVVKTELARYGDVVYFSGVFWIYRNLGGIFQKSVEQGTQTTIHCAVDEQAGDETGLYYSDCKPVTPSSLAQDAEKAKKLWDISIELVKLQGYDPFKFVDTPPRPKTIAIRPEMNLKNNESK